MFAQTILLPVDFSEDSLEARKVASALASAWKARLVIMHAESPYLALGHGEMTPDLAASVRADLVRQLKAIAPTEPDIEYIHRLVVGEPTEAILRTAEQEHADLIVMGTHGRTGLSRFLMGSVAEAVVRQANCPVLTFKLPAGVPAAA